LRKIELASLEDVPDRVDSVKCSLEIIYGVKLGVALEDVPIARLFPTEDFLENDKLGLVLMKVVTEGYSVPIIAVRRGENFFVLDGHHRSYVSRKLLRKSIKANVLSFPDGACYRDVVKRSLDDLPIKEVAEIDDTIVRAWQRTLSILKHYEAMYAIPFFMSVERVFLKDLVATQAYVGRTQVEAIKKLLVPIVCVEYRERFYILDGHARAYKAKQMGLKWIRATVLMPAAPIDFGIVKTAEELDLRNLDLEVIDQ
jgi:IMP dehydrogenase